MVVKVELIERCGYDRAEAMDILWNVLRGELNGTLPAFIAVLDSGQYNAYDVVLIDTQRPMSKWEDQTPEALDVWSHVKDVLASDFGFVVDFSVKK